MASFDDDVKINMPFHLTERAGEILYPYRNIRSSSNQDEATMRASKRSAFSSAAHQNVPNPPAIALLHYNHVKWSVLDFLSVRDAAAVSRVNREWLACPVGYRRPQCAPSPARPLMRTYRSHLEVPFNTSCANSVEVAPSRLIALARSRSPASSTS